MRRFQSWLLLGGAPSVLAAVALSSAAHAGEAVTVAGQASAGEAGQSEVNEVVVTGVRGRPRTVANSPVPIDIISHAQITETGKVGLKAIFSSVIPSFTLPAQNGGGTSASVSPYTVEGLTSDYVLVLVNGKRRHNTALINNLATIGGGSTPVDLDLIPPSAIDHIELLRDGAAAQYGSDAIAGVINIILKDGVDGGEAEATTGQTYLGRGVLGQLYTDYGHPFFGGSIHFALSFDHHEPAPTNGPSTGLLYPLVGGAPDPREASGNKDYGSAYGRSTLDNTLNLSYNLSTPIGHGLEFYSFSTFSYRDIKDARGAFRPDDLSSLPAIFPDGFQAYRLIHERDFQAAAGVKGDLAGWQWDLSSTISRDYAWLGASNTLNASLGPTVDQTSFHVGTQIFDQWVNNLDVSRGFNVGLPKPLDVSWGIEQRREQFAEEAGELNSYVNGGYVVPNDGTPYGNLYHGQFTQAGLQSFTGATPSDASTHSRNNYAAYVDLGTNLTNPWYVGLAARGEHFDDSSGDTASGKFTTRYEILPGLALRGAISNGFHAPSLAEQWFSTTQNTSALNSSGDVVAAQVKFLPANSALAKALGASPLTPEKSTSYTLGLTYEPIRRFRATVDAYQINIDNRIVKSSVLTGVPIQNILQPLGFSNLSSAQYFTNAVNTRTTGLDVVLEYQQSLDAFGSINWSAAYAENQTVITHVKANPTVLSGLGSSFQFFAPLAQRQLTSSTPRDKIALGADWSLDRWLVHLGETRYGGYLEPINNTTSAKFTPKWITDLDVTFKLRHNLSLSVGANNLLNVYPDRESKTLLNLQTTDATLTSATGYKADPAAYTAYGIPTSGADIYGTNSPFGYGGFYYVRVGLKF